MTRIGACSRGILLAAPLFAAAAGASGPQRFGVGLHDAAWSLTSEPGRCLLQQSIPGYGTAGFEQAAGGAPGFAIEVLHPHHAAASAVLRERAPAWVDAPPEDRHIQLATVAGPRPIRLDHAQTGWLLDTLARGRLASFDLRDPDEGVYPLRVELSPVRFQGAYRAFLACCAALPDELETARPFAVREIPFALDRAELNAGARALLDGAAVDLQGRGAGRLVIEGHADHLGSERYNLALSQRRARAVRDYLVAAGVDPAGVEERVFGESRPKASNASVAGRSANRRVEIRWIDAAR